MLVTVVPTQPDRPNTITAIIANANVIFFIFTTFNSHKTKNKPDGTPATFAELRQARHKGTYFCSRKSGKRSPVNIWGITLDNPAATRNAARSSKVLPTICTPIGTRLELSITGISTTG